VAEAAEALRRLLAAIDAGEIDADDPKARALRRRLEGAMAAWDETSSGVRRHGKEAKTGTVALTPHP